MKQKKLVGQCLSMSFFMLLTTPVLAGNFRGEPDASARCEEAREILIAPEREKLISKCVAENKGVSYCENYYRDYGSGGTGAGGKYRSRKFNDIDSCKMAKKEAAGNRSSSQGVTRGRTADDFTTRDGGTSSSNRDTNEADSGREGSSPSSR